MHRFSGKKINRPCSNSRSAKVRSVPVYSSGADYERPAWTTRLSTSDALCIRHMDQVFLLIIGKVFRDNARIGVGHQEKDSLGFLKTLK